MLEEQIVESLRQLGLTATEGKAYVALLQSHPATGYELSARSSVPRSAIYDVLNRLKELGVINAIQERPQKFVPLPPQKLVDLLSSRFSHNLDLLKHSLENFDADVEEAVTWTLRGYDSMLEQARALIEAAETTVYGSIWSREAIALERSLRKAKKRGVEIVLFSFNDLSPDLGNTFCYGIRENELEKYWSHKIILIGDRGRLLVGGAEEVATNRSVMTEEPGLIEMAISNLVLDMTLFAGRMKVDVGEVLQGLTEPFAPVEELLRKKA